MGVHATGVLGHVHADDAHVAGGVGHAHQVVQNLRGIFLRRVLIALRLVPDVTTTSVGASMRGSSTCSTAT